MSGEDPIKYGGRFRHSPDVDAFLNQPARVKEFGESLKSTLGSAGRSI